MRILGLHIIVSSHTQATLCSTQRYPTPRYITPARQKGWNGLGATVIAWALLLCSLVTTPVAHGAPIRIGVLTVSWGPTPGVVGLIEGLVARGYRENEDFVIGIRFTQGNTGVLPTVAREMVQDGVDIFFCVGESETKAVRTATNTHPIVFAEVGDPVGHGLVTSYARPGGNTTGVTDLSKELSGKRLQLFKELHPGLRRVMFPYHGNNKHQAIDVKQYRIAAQHLGIVLIERKLYAMEEAREVLTGLRREDIDGILAPRDVDLNIPGFVLEATRKQGIPSMFVSAFYLKDGGLTSYGPSWFASGRQAARLVDKIIKGANPGDLPVEVNNYFEFVVNLKVAKTLGMTIPPIALYQADRVIR